MWTQIEGSMISDLASIFLENGLSPSEATLKKIANKLQIAFYESNKDYLTVMSILDREIEYFKANKKTKKSNNTYKLMYNNELIITSDKLDTIIIYIQQESKKSYSCSKTLIYNYIYNNNKKILKKYDLIKEKK